ncbi:multicopper oxidase domain-containing protein [Roseibacillus persicicus]|uniref:multicopper oxidase domain-containing protein n=1 Tax=Roseibacillus persicicus TaxID=454148 RepID=UPI00280D0C87|nr:multicopper oxidase domain-containing protein [Roseibacillus persicicus]MDQ8190244.1 multicopper oxidase domain-containing protein [Roseibacillus persicicus]
MKTALTSRVRTLLSLLLLQSATQLIAKEQVYNLTIAEQEVNFTGKPRPGMTINGSIPGPVLRFTEGDVAVMNVTNGLKEPSSIHWHGLLVPPSQDGVPHISFPPIPPGETFTYRFPLRQSGTYWYHSHSSLQEQSGVYGSIVVQPRKKRYYPSKESVLLLSDWTDSDPHKVMRLLRRGSEAMGVQKKTSQSLLGAIKTDKLGEFWKREAMRMPPMDIADVAYDAFLINGRRTSEIAAKPGDTIRLRIINGSATTYFHLQYAGGPVKIISADGQDVEPVNLKTPLLIGVAETYDVLVKVPANGSYEFRATAQDGSGHASVWIGSGERKPAPDMPQPYVYDTMDMFGWKKMFALTPEGTMGMPTRRVRQGAFDQPGMNMEMPGMKMSGMDHSGMDMIGMKVEGMDHSGMGNMTIGGMKMEGEGIKLNPPKWYDFLLREDAARFPELASDNMSSTLRPFPPYKKLRALKDTSFDSDQPVREVRLTLDGDMSRYVWMFNNEVLKPENDILINEGEVVRFVFINRTMMHHPLHLHGHFFRVINGQGDRAPLKHTVNVAPMTTTVIEFDANEVGDWFFHCHLLYHMKAGMARVVRYNSFTNDPETEAISHRRYDQNWYPFLITDVLSNMNQGAIRYENLKNIFTLSWEAGWNDIPDDVDALWEADLTYNRYLNRFTTLFAGVYGEGSMGGEDDFELESERAIAGIRYTLPFNIHSSAWIDHEGEARITLERELMLTPRLGIFGEAEFDTQEYWSGQAGASYLINENFSATGLWDSNYGWGAGVTIKF